ncbi:MAG: hypothetical protein ACI9Y1_003409 [Lentisphaeria bacterium]|jgi:hypothetical protein
MKSYIFLLILILTSFNVNADENKDSIFDPNQTSASLLISFSEERMNQADPRDKGEAEIKHLLAYDVYIKARSYALLNKIFFFISIIFGLLVLIWPSFSVIFKSKLSRWEWVKSATVQTTVTGIAALTFAFYSQYKDKQTYAETLMRHVVYSEISTSLLSKTVSDELNKIDRGFSFNSIVENKSGNKTNH